MKSFSKYISEGIFDTIKGKGWSETENKTGIHHVAITDEMMERAEKEFEEKTGGIA